MLEHDSIDWQQVLIKAGVEPHLWPEAVGEEYSAQPGNTLLRVTLTFPAAVPIMSSAVPPKPNWALFPVIQALSDAYQRLVSYPLDKVVLKPQANGIVIEGKPYGLEHNTTGT